MSSSKQVSSELQAAQARTLARLAKIHEQFHSTPGSGRFKGKVAILTGVGSEKGIGRASAVLLAREGAKHLYVMDFNASSLPQLAKDLEARYKGLKVTAIEADAANEDAISSVCEQAIREEGRLDCFFANAGIVGANLLQHTEPSEFMEVFRVNTLSCFLAVKHASEAMKVVQKDSGKTETGGSIILTASVAGIRSGAGPIDYSASKAGVINIANTCANGLFGTNIRVNAICPGLIETGMTTYTFERAKERGTLGKVGQLNPLRRFGIAEEIAQAVLFLASDDSSYVNGIHLPVDGGLSSSHPVVPGQAF
ncbi:BZ3500_MvSof-1268-A1-R1_Chr10-3g03076 [Microbotryum saponariae]|uniref:BZ3500_MvSof-1268-A1-R1_Chr10-3g03076 protein n=1 Tax=Microbotryum saponariae TaxID=289078 RepID=A0A2X0L630_9BASI|nr:BZ3501_MvSof-1269-A2-R1_Chr10-2g02654 [Microbotryum saponariae]SDA02104.1 BZ3500_MvSof-1268-A1-R1_Chr10-3g03076 [Microbotryum saponariae]